MGKTANEDKSDGLEIISIGKLYAGPWEKKYWSSSRGKDRYPYPVGYKSVRTQNGVTYTMEIVEGLKGPSFTISSTDGKSCSGGTPDIAWESFQKKGCSKLWHAKRLSSKIEGVEFFGFRNSFVQRLLRELVANVGETTEQSLLPSKFSGEASANVHQLQCKPSSSDPDLLAYLVKSHVKGKRSRNDRVDSNKRLNGTHFKQHQQEECTKNVSSSTFNQRDQSNCETSDLSTFSAANVVSSVCYSPGSLVPENLDTAVTEEKSLLIEERCVKLDSLDISDHLKAGGALSEEERKFTGSMNHCGLDIDNVRKKQEPIDKSRHYEVQESNNITSEDRDGATNVQQDKPVLNDADLCVADTLDHAGDSSSVSSPKKDVQVDWIVKDAVINDVAKSEVLVTDSLPEDEIGTSSYITNSEKCDTDSVGQEIAKSMMTVLLPRAVPLLKTFYRKKRKSPKPSVTPTHRSREENNMPSISMNDSIFAGVLAEHSDLERKNEKAVVTCAGHDTAVCTSVKTDSVVPDSFDNDGPQDLLPHADSAQACKLSCGQCSLSKLPINVDLETNQLPCHSGSSEHETGTTGLKLVAATDTLASVKEFTSNSKRTRFDCHFIDNLSYIHASTTNKTSTSESIMCRSFPDICISEKAEDSFARLRTATNFTDCGNLSSNLQIPSTSCRSSLIESIKTNDDSRSNVQHKAKLNSKLESLLELFACYVHPTPISMVQLIVKQNEIFTCVKCGYSENKEDTLFVYKAPKKGEKMGCPSLIGHVSIALQISKNVPGRDIAFERSLLQLTPDGQSLVLINSIKLPYCREGKLHCSCPACTSDCFEKNALKIVRLNRGYASLVTKLKTNQAVCCLLVCEPSFLVAAVEGGKLKLWLMNSAWSGHKEDWYLPTLESMFPGITELKTVPKSAVLVVGHNGFGEFGIWDIDKRYLISRFSSPGMSVLESIPVGVFRWQRKGEYKTEALVGEIMDATKTWFSGSSKNHVFSPEDKDVAVWLLISTNSDLDSQCYQSCEQEANVGGCWRLALLVNNTVITGSIVDGGAAAAATSFGHGIIGRCDGQVYVWELSTGMKIGNLHSFNGSRVSCVTTDTSNSGALAIASEGQLLVYLPS